MKEGRSFLNLKGTGGDGDIFHEISRRSKTYVEKPGYFGKASDEIIATAAIY
jgi:hypothetical protein